MIFYMDQKDLAIKLSKEEQLDRIYIRYYAFHTHRLPFW